MNPNVTVINPTITEDKESKIRVACILQSKYKFRGSAKFINGTDEVL